MKIGKTLTDLRARMHITQDEMADRLGVKRARYNAWENNIAKPDLDMIGRLAEAHGVSVDYLLGRSSEAAPYPQAEKHPISAKEERDIARDLEKMMNDLESNEALAFHGEAMDEQTKELLRLSLENSMRLAKQLSKQKFTPHKYRQ
ncbi:helix-turn-helix domain-containing protein [Gorillibacterium timonense]|uniref:helix-turn-helix domain-containing protein n=1 Tax=Gorillibacterium timonense TaxID=1689269 RepID=UPI00071D96CC|nr:helix-turn-helix transcriptional regulator [Gorillibacterium timonense]